MYKRCQAGKSCGKTCISNLKKCLKDLNQAEGSLPKVRDLISGEQESRSAKLERIEKEYKLMAGQSMMDSIGKKMEENEVTFRMGDKNYNWENSKDVDSGILGAGEYGVVTIDKSNGNVVKTGYISENEAKVIDRVGRIGLGPKLVAAVGHGAEEFMFIPGEYTTLANGKIAMTRVPGEEIGFRRQPTDMIGGKKVANSFWEARAELHRNGVAHNDMHPGNVMIDDKGKARFVDFGSSISGYKAALSEAMGAFSRESDSFKGDFQVLRNDSTGGGILKKAVTSNGKDVAEMSNIPALQQVWNNRGRVIRQMKEDGISPRDIMAIIDHKLNSKPESYDQGVWSSISDSQAKKYVDMLYDGV